MTDVAVIQLASWGDVVISTIITRAIKEQRPDWVVTYYTSGACAGAILNNPDIDHLVIVPGTNTKDQAWGAQDRVIADARRHHQKIITPWAGWLPRHDWRPLPLAGWDNDISNNFMWAYVRAAQQEGLTITRPPIPQLHPTTEERRHAEDRIAPLRHRTKKVLMEVEGHSSQSWLNEQWVMPIMEILTSKYGTDTALLISKVGPDGDTLMMAKRRWPGLVHVLSDLSLREVACLFNDCYAFIGCSSGTSNACHAQFCKRGLPWFEAIKSTEWDSRPLGEDGKCFYYNADHNGFFNLLREHLP